jgi:hypothetical protein
MIFLRMHQVNAFRPFPLAPSEIASLQLVLVALLLLSVHPHRPFSATRPARRFATLLPVCNWPGARV